MDKKKVFKCVLDEDGQLGVYAIGLVSEPAIQESWVALNDMKLASVNDERHMLYGPALIPNKQILRLDKDGNEYYIYFEAETIYKCAHLFMKKHLQNAANIEHDTPIQSGTVVESWIIEDTKHDKSAHLGMSFPVGTWMLGMHIEDDNTTWQQVKDGEITGFSIEGRFDQIKLSLSVEAKSISGHDEMWNEIEQLVALYPSKT
jgi:hypothetical protein